MEAVAAAAAAHAQTEAAEEAGQAVLRSHHGHYVELPPLPGQPRQSRRVVVPLPTFAMRAGVRDTIWFDPEKVTAAVVTTGSICPGMNDVVSALVQRLGAYGVPDGQILGIRYGFEGFTAHGSKPVPLSPRNMDMLHLSGGSCLGSGSPLTYSDDATLRSRMRGVAQKLADWDVNMLFVVGGEGGNTLGADLAHWCAVEEVPCVVVGVPKTIDNDFLLLDKGFGFDTAVEQAQLPLLAAKTEASSALRGIGLVKLFGRRSGFLTMQASLASGVVDACLIPEVRIDMPALLEHLGQLLEDRGHAVVCVAEGAGQELLFAEGEPRPTDEAGNPILRDIGAHLKKALKSGPLGEVDLKYIDPTHLVEATASNAADHVLAKTMGQHAADAAMAGFTGVMCGVVNGHHCLLPSHVVTQSYRCVHPYGKAYNRLRASTGQPF
ncbi:MAG: phosphofructokinase family protein [Monoraphidium minutum]|nr:MAG: phosphofructokinase family protein [Monoraphidium minutum]